MKNVILLIFLVLSLFTVNAQDFQFSETFKKNATVDFCECWNAAKGASFEEKWENTGLPFFDRLENNHKEEVAEMLKGYEITEDLMEKFGAATVEALNETLILNCDSYYHFFRDLRVNSYNDLVAQLGTETYLEVLENTMKEDDFETSSKKLAFAGIVFFANGNYEQSAVFLKKTFEIEPNSDLFDLLAYVYEQLGDYEKALQVFENLPKTKAVLLNQAIVTRNQKEPKSNNTLPPNANPYSHNEYFTLWQNFETKLTKKVKSHQSYDDFEAEKDGIKLVTYPSEDLKLKGLLNTTNIEKGKKKPAIVYLHGGWALGYSDVTDCQAFTDAGYVVFAPSYRGENGNDGNVEVFLGEVDDAKAAIKWLQAQPYIDAENVSVFGHSAGGALALTLSLHPDIAIKKCGGVAGVFDSESFAYWKEEKTSEITFDLENEDEIYMRLPVAFLQYMEREHFLYIGEEDGFEGYKDWINELYEEEFPAKLKMIEVKGDHFSSLKPAIDLFLKELKK